MNRSALALLGLLALPLTAAAQNRPLLANEPPPERLPESNFSITPYIGLRVPFNTGTEVLVTGGGDQFQLRWERGGGPMAGVDVAARVRGPFHLVAGGAYSGRRDDLIFLQSSSTTIDTLVAQGPAYWFAKAGVQVRLADPTPDNRRFHPSAFITAAPAVVFADFNDIPGFSAAANRDSHHFGLNLGVDAAARVGRSDQWSFSVGVQDYLLFWDTDRLVARDTEIGEALVGEPVTVAFDYGNSNVLALRFGVSYRFR